MVVNALHQSFVYATDIITAVAALEGAAAGMGYARMVILYIS